MQRPLSDRYAGSPYKGIPEEKNWRKKGLIKFNGNSFADEDRQTTSFSFSVANADTVDHRIALFAGELATPAEILSVAGISVDAIATDGVVLKDLSNDPLLTVTARRPLAYLQKFVKKNPTRVVSFQITASDQSQLHNPFTMTKINPFQGLGNMEFIPKNYQKATDSNPNMVEVKMKHFQLDDQGIFDVVVGAGKTVQVTMFVGAQRNDAYTLAEEAVAALGE